MRNRGRAALQRRVALPNDSGFSPRGRISCLEAAIDCAGRTAKKTSVTATSRGKAMGARQTKWKRNGCARPSPKNLLQKPLRPKPSNRVSNWRSPENPACHRKANRRVTQMHYFHKTPSRPTRLVQGRGTNMNLYRHNSNAPTPVQGTSVPSE